MQVNSEAIARWNMFEIAMDGPKGGNPFVDVQLAGRFRHKNRVVEAAGFYDGDGVYRIRFMPDIEGQWSFETASNAVELDGKSGVFECTEAAKGCHGPVRVREGKFARHFQYEDGTAYHPFGTTCYAWIHQGDELAEQTLKTLAGTCFNKLRMLVFPKRMEYNENEPQLYPFEGKPLTEWDFARFNPAYFRNLERRVGDLMALGIEADVILFHPYDKGHWGFDHMPVEADDRYLRYVVARLAAYRNVWWSFANEYDLMPQKKMTDWDRYFRVVQEADPYQHLRSVHNHTPPYDHNKPWVTHASLQTPVTSQGLEEIHAWYEQYKKPMVIDECLYEGNIPIRWGNITAEEMVRRCWIGTVAGGYVGHGETYVHPQDILWWAKGGALHGQSHERIAFLREIVEDTPEEGIVPLRPWNTWRGLTAGVAGKYYLFYTSFARPASLPLVNLPEGKYKVEIIDTWKMTIEAAGVFEAGAEVKLPGEPYLAVRIRRVD